MGGRRDAGGESADVADVRRASEESRDELTNRGRAAASETAASYERRWRVWTRFCAHHGVLPLPANEHHAAAFVLARLGAGISPSAIGANLAAVRWYHVHRTDPPIEEVTDLARRVLSMQERVVPRRAQGAPVVSVGALESMCRIVRPAKLVNYSARLVRHLSGLSPRQLMAIRVDGIDWVPFGAILHVPALQSAGRAGATPAVEVRLERFAMLRFCPVEALEVLVDSSGDEMLFTPGLANPTGAKGWDPVGDTSGLAWAIASRNRALVAVGYHGALRAAELVKARAEDLEWLPERQRFILKIPSSKTSGVNADFVPLPATGKESCPVAALQDWFDYRGPDDGPLFGQIHHGITADRGISAGEIRKVLAALAQRAGVESSVTAHSLRRSWATHSWLNGGDGALESIMVRLRHTGPEITGRYIEDLGVHVLDPSSFLDPTVVTATPDRPLPTQTAEFAAEPLDQLVDQADRLVAKADYAPSTLHGYTSSWNTWSNWAEEHGFAPFPADPDHVALFVAARQRDGLSVSSITGYLAAIRAVHLGRNAQVGGLTSATAAILEGARRTGRRPAHPAPILTISEIAAMADAARAEYQCTGDWRALRDEITVVFGFTGALRGNDLLRLRLDDFTTIDDKVVVARMSASKQNQRGRRPERVRLDDQPGLRPMVGLLNEWRTVNDPDAPLLARHQGANGPVSYDSVRYRLRRTAVRAGLETVPAVHSLRRSWASYAYTEGLDIAEISRHLRHTNPTMTPRYVERHDPWRHSPDPSQ